MNSDVPPKRTYFLDYMGHLNVHHVYSKPMLQWIVAEIKFRRKPVFCSLSLSQEGFSAQKEAKVLIDMHSFADEKRFEAENADLPSGFDHPLSPLDQTAEKNHKSNGFPLTYKLAEIADLILPNDLEKNCVGILKYPTTPDRPFVCHLFQDKEKALIMEISENMTKWIAWHQSVSPSVNGKDQEYDCIKFETMMLGKIQVKQEFPQSTFIDEAVEKYHSLEMEHKMELQNIQKLATDLPDSPFNGANDSHTQFNNTASLIDDSRDGAMEILRRNSSAILTQDPPQTPGFDRQRCSSIDTPSSTAMRQRLRGRTRHCSEPGATSALGFDKNKIRLLLIGKQSITFICPDMTARKIQLQFTEITRCCKGINHKDHFGIFAKDQNACQRNDDFKFRCYLFKCSDESVCDEILLALKQSCSMCAHGIDPLKSYHSVCKRMNQISGAASGQQWVEKGMTIAAKFIAENLSEPEQRAVRSKIEECCKSRQVELSYEKLVVVMTVLRCFYLEKQHEHDHRMKQFKEPNSNVISKRLNFFKSKAKKSLTSFESFFEKGFQKMHELQNEAEQHISSPIEKLKFFGDNQGQRGGTSPGPAGNLNNAVRLRNLSGSPRAGTDLSPLAAGNNFAKSNDEQPRPRSSTVGAVNQSALMARRKLNMNNKNDHSIQASSGSAFSPVKAANPALKLSNSSLKSISTESTPTQSRSPSPSQSEGKPRLASASTGKKMSFHQEIFQRVSGSSQKKKKPYPGTPTSLQHFMKPLASLKTPEDLRYAWRRAIRDQMMINRIQNLQPTANGDATHRPQSLKLNYSDVGPACPEMDKVWLELLDTQQRTDYKIDFGVLQAAVKRGVSRKLRGQVWSILHEQWCLQHREESRSSIKRSLLSSRPYRELLKSLTPHQHAILIDLGRTFPSHPYFKKQLQSGQLDLFNLLKAYSLADPDVGYCQGLSFVAGFILMHTNTVEEAYNMLTHLMFNIGCRNLYLPDMEALRVAVYQLSRLLHDFHRDLFDHLEQNDVALMLFSTPWFLTMFASILSYNFTSRIFDLLFLEGKAALFKVALCLLNHHKQKILAEDSFESIVGYLKSKMLDMDDEELQDIVSKMFETNITDKLQVYEVEYTVLEEGEIFGEDAPSGEDPPKADSQVQDKMARLEHVNETVIKYNLELAEQLEAAKMQIKSLQQGLTDMVEMDEKRSLELENVKAENRVLRQKISV